MTFWILMSVFITIAVLLSITALVNAIKVRDGIRERLLNRKNFHF